MPQKNWFRDYFYTNISVPISMYAPEVLFLRALRDKEKRSPGSGHHDKAKKSPRKKTPSSGQ